METTGNITIIEPVSRFKKVDISLIENERIDCTTLGVYTKLIVLGKKWNLNVRGLRKGSQSNAKLPLTQTTLQI